MQIKTIQRIIHNKLTEWLESITDDKLRKKVEKNCLLSGGSITSMLLNMDVNDYDIYIKDMDVLLELTKYYTDGVPDVGIMDGRLRDDYIKGYGGDVYSDDNSYTIAVRNLKPDQIKLFFQSEKGGIKLDPLEGSKYTPAFLSPNAISLTDNIQIVIRFHGDNEAIHKTFDYVHATNYFTFESGLVTNKEALESIITKQLKYQGSMYPLTSIIRMKKFIKRNWNISAGEILKIMFQISELDLKNPDVLEEQLIGVDIAYFGKLIEILRDVKEEKITSPYLNTIIDRVFNQFDDTSDSEF